MLSIEQLHGIYDGGRYGHKGRPLRQIQNRAMNPAAESHVPNRAVSRWSDYYPCHV